MASMPGDIITIDDKDYLITESKEKQELKPFNVIIALESLIRLADSEGYDIVKTSIEADSGKGTAKLRKNGEGVRVVYDSNASIWIKR